MPGLIVLVGSDDKLVDRNRGLIKQMAALISNESYYQSHFIECPEMGLHACRVSLDHEPSAGAIASINNDTIQCLIGGELFDTNDLKSRLGNGQGNTTNHAAIVARLYEQYGDEVVQFLNGYFNLLLVDRRTGAILVANDRFGMQRFYHAALPNGGMLFAPETKCFTLMPELDLHLDTTAVAHSFRYGCLVRGRSFYREVKRFPLATAFVNRNGGWNSYEYWSLEKALDQPRISAKSFVDDGAAVFESLLEEYVTDGQTALSFTGGMDNRAIFSVLSRRGIKLPMYTFGGPLRESHDIKIARKLAKRSGYDWTPIRLGSEFLDDFEHWASRATEITDGIARLETCHEYYLNVKAREFGKVRLTGKYGSELLRGGTILRDRSPDLRIFSPDFRDHYVSSNEHITGRGLKTRMREELPHMYCAFQAQEMAAVTLRIPYIDKRLVDLILLAPEMGDNTSLQSRISLRNAPHLANIPTNRGVWIDDSGAAKPLTYYLKLTNFIDSVYNWPRLPGWARTVCAVGDITGISRIFVGRHEWLHYRKWFNNELKDFLRDLILDPHTRNREFYDGNALEKMINDHFAGRANYTSEIIKIGSFELWCRHNEQLMKSSGERRAKTAGAPRSTLTDKH